MTGLGIGAGIWAALTLLIAYFLVCLVSTTVTDRPDRAGRSSMALWSGPGLRVPALVARPGDQLGLSGLFGALGLTRTVATVATGQSLRGDLVTTAGVHGPVSCHGPTGVIRDRLRASAAHWHIDRGGPDGARLAPRPGGRGA